MHTLLRLLLSHQPFFFFLGRQHITSHYHHTYSSLCTAIAPSNSPPYVTLATPKTIKGTQHWTATKSEINNCTSKTSSEVKIVGVRTYVNRQSNLEIYCYALGRSIYEVIYINFIYIYMNGGGYRNGGGDKVAYL